MDIAKKEISEGLIFKGSTYTERSNETNSVLSYCMLYDILIPEWLEIDMRDWPRFRHNVDRDVLPDFYDSRVGDDLDRWRSVAKYSLFIVDELEGEWAIWYTRIQSDIASFNGYTKQSYAFELESDAMAFKLRWL